MSTTFSWTLVPASINATQIYIVFAESGDPVLWQNPNLHLRMSHSAENIKWFCKHDEAPRDIWGFYPALRLHWPSVSFGQAHCCPLAASENTQCVAGEKHWSSAWAEMVMQWSHHSRCNTLTVACCEKWGGRGGQPGLFLKPLSEPSIRLRRKQHYSARLLTFRGAPWASLCHAVASKASLYGGSKNAYRWIFEKKCTWIERDMRSQSYLQYF